MNFFYNPLNQEFWFFLILSIFVIIFSFYQIYHNRKIQPIIIIRILIVLFLVTLFIDPKFEFRKVNKRDLQWDIYIDRSLSMSYHSQPSLGSFISGTEKMIDRILENDVSLNIYGFGEGLDTNWITGNKLIQDGATDIGQVINNIQNKDRDGIAGSIIITDGQANIGNEIPLFDLNIFSPIYVIGVGDEKPLVDISIHSIDVPPVVIKGEDIDLDVTISSYGILNEKLNVTLFSDEKIVGSKMVTVYGNGSLEKVKFRISPSKTGQINYKAKVNVLEDEINIDNNSEVIPIQVLKNEYRIAIITGAPNFNTHVLKEMINKNYQYSLDHYILQDKSYSQPLDNFWDSKYDLIIFDNNPVFNNYKEWESYIRIFAKKVVSQQSSIAFFFGEDIHLETIEKFTQLIDISLKDPLVDLSPSYEWEITENWETLFPFRSLTNNDVINSYPPIKPGFEINADSENILAHYAISGVEIPLITVGEKSPIRFLIWSSPELYYLYYKTNETKSNNLIDNIFNPILSWLMKTGNGESFYFRTNNNSYQQGEKIILTGKPVQINHLEMEGVVHIFINNEKINSKPLIYNAEKDIYVSHFWASHSGEIDYKVEFYEGENTINVSNGSIIVQESQVELNHVYLNKTPLLQLTENNNGKFYYWDKRFELINNIKTQIKTDIQYSKISLYNSNWFFLILISLLTLDWILRRKLGLM